MDSGFSILFFLQFHHRDPGILGLLTSVPIYFGLINDGCHTHPAAVKIAYRAHYDGKFRIKYLMNVHKKFKPTFELIFSRARFFIIKIKICQPESFSNFRFSFAGLILVTDAISALGLHEGIHRIGELEIEIKNNCAYISGTNTLCGSMLPLNGCVRLLDEFTRKFQHFS